MLNSWLISNKKSFIEIPGLVPISLTASIRGYAFYVPLNGSKNTSRLLIDVDSKDISQLDLSVLRSLSSSTPCEVKVPDNSRIKATLSQIINSDSLVRYIFQIKD